MSHRFSGLRLLGACLLLAVASQAQAAKAGTGYFGITTGKSSFGYTGNQCKSDFYGEPCTVENSATAFRVLAGYNVTRNFGVEFAYDNFGAMYAAVDFPGTLSGVVTTKQEYSAGNFDLVGNIDLGNSGLTLSARVGVYVATDNATDNYYDGVSGDANTKSSSSGTDYAIAGSFAINPSTSLRLEYMHFGDLGKTDTRTFVLDYAAPLLKSDVSAFTFGLVTTFN